VLGDIDLEVDVTDNNVDYLTLYGSLVDRLFDADVAHAAVLDVGAHKGYYAARCLYAGAAIVHSYEPAESNFRSLARSAEGTGGWHVHRCALGDHQGTVRLHLSDQSWGHSLVGLGPGRDAGTEEVDLMSLNTALARVSASGLPVHVKINVEGAAGTMLCSTSPQDWNDTHTIWMDYEPWDPVSYSTVESHLKHCGFDPTATDGRRRRWTRRSEPK
jgi:FkbM family methyltransferase